MNSGVHEVGTMRPVRAFHIMPGVPGPEGELHAHDYRVEVVVERPKLDDRAMVCDLDVLNAALTETIAQIDGQDLEQIRPPSAEAVTVEVLARWVHASLAEAVREAGGTVLAVRVWESADAFGGYRASVWPVADLASGTTDLDIPSGSEPHTPAR
jgi:6-pyruvoyltetrahydropterin/6-carboxytetrahydropterin synthase